jgi:starch synthase
MDTRRFRICYLSSEVAPFAKTGGLADVADALPRSLAELGHDVRVFVPLYGTMDLSFAEPKPLGEPVSIAFGHELIEFRLLEGMLRRSQTPVYFIDCPRFYERNAIYTNDPDEPLRYLFFCRAVLESCQRLGFSPHVFHCNDWQSAMLPLLVQTLYSWDQLFAHSKSLLTVHNIGYQGVFSADIFDSIGIHDPKLLDTEDLRAGRINFLKTGLMRADLLSTVSPTYAREIQTEEQGYGLDRVLRRRGGELFGILNGIDGEEWNPQTDRFIPYRFSSKNLWRKTKNKESLLTKLEMEYDESVPLLGLVTRLAPQKGIEILFESLPDVLTSERLSVVVLGAGEARYEDFFSGLQHRFAGRVCFYRGIHEQLAHWVEAGSDMFLMPSLYEPCGLNQMYSLAYGTVPIVRRTGGLADSVSIYDPDTGSGNGIVFDHFTNEGVRWALRAALSLYRQPDTWKRIIQNAMAKDFTWGTQSAKYVALYRRLCDAADGDSPSGKDS